MSWGARIAVEDYCPDHKKCIGGEIKLPSTRRGAPVYCTVKPRFVPGDRYVLYACRPEVVVLFRRPKKGASMFMSLLYRTSWRCAVEDESLAMWQFHNDNKNRQDSFFQQIRPDNRIQPVTAACFCYFVLFCFVGRLKSFTKKKLRLCRQQKLSPRKKIRRKKLQCDAFRTLFAVLQVRPCDHRNVCMVIAVFVFPCPAPENLVSP